MDTETQDIAAIDFRHFSLAYLNTKRGLPLHVLQDVTLSVQPGEIITIVGPSGCGKTTLLRVVAGLLTPADHHVVCDGSLNVFGASSAQAKQQRMFAFTFQNPALLPWRSVRQNVRLPFEIMKRKRPSHGSLVDDMLAMVGLADFAHAMPSELSGGMQQRANLARALVQEPKVLLMDEPFGSLDEVTRERLNFELIRIHRLKTPTILFVTHSLSEATLLADRIVILSTLPATIRQITVVDLPRERNEDTLLSAEYLNLVRRVRDVFSRENAAI